jgi:hypothetical protein
MGEMVSSVVRVFGIVLLLVAVGAGLSFGILFVLVLGLAALVKFGVGRSRMPA